MYNAKKNFFKIRSSAYSYAMHSLHYLLHFYLEQIKNTEVKYRVDEEHSLFAHSDQGYSFIA